VANAGVQPKASPIVGLPSQDFALNLAYCDGKQLTLQSTHSNP
jgi:hypothetical protein